MNLNFRQRSFLKGQFVDRKGSALVLVMLAMVALGVVTFVVMSNRKADVQNIQRSTADEEIAKAMDAINAVMRTPSHCNANFRNKKFLPPYSTLAGIYKCSGGNCSGTGSVVPFININQWEMYADEPLVKRKARIVSLTYELTAEQATAAPGARPRPGSLYSQPAMLTVKVTFEKNVGVQSGAVKTIRTKEYTVQVYVVTSIHNPTASTLTDNPSGLIYGCGRSPSSTVVL